MTGNQAVVALTCRLETPLLVLAVVWGKLADFGAVCRRCRKPVNRLAAVTCDQTVVAAAGRFHSPVLVVPAVARPLDHSCAVSDRRAADVQTHVAVPRDELIHAFFRIGQLGLKGLAAT